MVLWSYCPAIGALKANGIQVQRIGALPVNTTVVTDIGSICSDCGKITVRKGSNG